MRQFMDVTEVYIKVFTELITYILKLEDKVPGLQSFPVKNDDLIDLSAKLNIAKALPLWWNQRWGDNINLKYFFLKQ